MNDFAISECIFHGSYISELGACPICLESQRGELAGFPTRKMIKGRVELANAPMPSAAKQKGNKVECDGYTFDSQGEYRRYQHLLLTVRMGIILRFAVHPKWELLPKLILPKHFAKRVQSAISYEADFSYFYEGVFIVEDYKASYGKSKRNDAKGITGKPIVTEASRLRHKLVISLLVAKYGDNFLFRIVTDAQEGVGL